MAELSLSGVVKRYGAQQVVHDFDLSIANEEFVVLVGPSGCGKSTTLRMIAGLEDISGGEIRIGDRVVNDLPPRARNISMVFQNYALYPHMTVAENQGFGLRMARRPAEEITSKVAQAAELLGLGGFLNRRPAALSGGQRQRVAMGRAMVREAGVFLFDEPLSNLDAKLRAHMRVEIRQLHNRLGTTTIYVTHDQIEAMTLADRIVVMDGGAIQQIGTPDEIYANPVNTFVAGFIGSPPMNLIAGHISGGRFTAPGIAVDDLPVHGAREVVLGVRPEDCHVAQAEAHLTGSVYGVEPTGDTTYLTIRAAEKLIEVKARRDYRADLETTETVAFDRNRIYLFDKDTGMRIG